MVALTSHRTVVRMKPQRAGAHHFAPLALEAIDVGVAVLSADLREIVYSNDLARDWLSALGVEGPRVTGQLAETLAGYVATRRALGKLPPAIRLQADERVAFYVKCVEARQHGSNEVLLLTREVLREPDLFRVIESRYGVTRREFRILAGIRLGKSNRMIANELAVSPSAVAKGVGRLLHRFDVPNRTTLVRAVERIAARDS